MKHIQRLVIFSLVLALFLTPISAAVNASNIIISYWGGTGITESGDFVVSFDISTLGTANVLGATRVEVQQKVSGKWKTVATYNTVTNPEIQSGSLSFYSSKVIYEDPVEGGEYRGYIRFYASNDTYSDSRELYTPSRII